MNMSEKKSFFQMMEPGQAFLFGIIEGVLVLCTIGFFILLFSGDAGSTAAVRTAPTVAAPTAAAPAAQAPSADIPEVTNDDHSRGAKNAKVTIVEYSDIECPFCSRFHDTMNQVVEEYGDDVAWVYRHFPLESIHPNARLAANAAECAAAQGEDFFEYADLMFARQSQGLGKENLLALAGELEYNTSKLESCMDEGDFNTLVSQQARDAQNAGGRGTPFSVVIDADGNQTALSGAVPFATVAAAVEAAL
jgi:protein-disulfide isomerase